MLFVSLCGPTFSQLETEFKHLHSFVDGVEVRLDRMHLSELDHVAVFIQRCSLPVMLTLRRRDQGGDFAGTEPERLALLEKVCACGPAYVDLESDVPLEYRKALFEQFPNVVFLSSHHNFTSTPENLEQVLAQMRNPYTHIYKIATFAQSTIDALRMLAFVRQHAQEGVIGICMGEEGRATRILAPVAGCALTYCAPSELQAVAPGQLTAQELQTTYHFKQLTPNTAVFALLGDPVDQSLGHLIHNAVFRELKLNAVYLKLRVAKEEVAAALEKLATLGFHGLSVTMPLKEAVVPHLAELSPAVSAIRAANTLLHQNGYFVGFNTDGIGALDSLERHIPVQNKQLLLLGAGGAAKSIVAEAIKRGARVTILNRTLDKAEELAKRFGLRSGALEELRDLNYDVLINCLPETEWLPEDWIQSNIIAMDIVYVPKLTPFLSKAQKRGCRLVYGYEMFIQQAVEQQLIWWNGQIDRGRVSEIITRVVTQNLQS